ncbi:alpha-D-ribose 1-methylphosphonate 5-triphosphate synthase subunit PhnI [Dethiosulfatibacter aminovorans DSM 17477]|uniref:Alpha-D-ribose 1-methylphosphonate 5-triphosphate synthase subunit PhnI n=1 Tax=Dethiosulfatibacter aminovorans DSM 17477 TaxID=1121476 RepID=A0A1M6AYJ8_9FIRM|nr:carbon-phosphorus lyase complex subunit PhnI [Dethiosulfatibacter aminovorans]SHI41540.1 alpha-D-ribose 1-methylphosphonate 5-triphosphate synthase subunit PhnI [Dethiosulfatibacter aminovorans DSM 17477]
MAYVAVKGGQTAIEESIKRLKYERLKKGHVLDVKAVESGLRGLVDQVMSESSLYDEEIASLAIKQTEGNPEEAVFLARAFRSTLERKHYSRIIESDTMDIERRISACFKDIQGGQILGAAYDYTHRLIDFSLVNEDMGDAAKWLEDFSSENNSDGKTKLQFGKVIDGLRKEGILIGYERSDEEPKDVTKEPLTFPATRGERLQVMTRGQTGTVTSLAYASTRGYGYTHPSVGELRVGRLPVHVDSPFQESVNEEDSYYIGSIKVTEVECLLPADEVKSNGERVPKMDIGYGICYGQNETKAIAMSILDRCLEEGGDSPTHDEEFILYHIDSVEATGFISHFKLPHYVTFQSDLDNVRKSQKE